MLNAGVGKGGEMRVERDKAGEREGKGEWGREGRRGSGGEVEKVSSKF